MYAILFLSIPLFQLALYKDKNYSSNLFQSLFSSFNLDPNKKEDKEKKPLFYSIFAYFWAYETGLNIGRFALNTIYLFLLLLYMLFKIFNGGFKEPKYNTAAFIISVYFIFQNSIYTLMTFLSVLFNGFSISSYYDGFYFMKDDIIQIKIIAYVFFIIPIFAISLSLLINSFKLCFHFKFIKNDLSPFLKNNNNNQEIQGEDNSRKIEEFKYINLIGDICILKEYRNDDLRRYLCYTTNNENNPILEENNGNIEININRDENNENNILNINNNKIKDEVYNNNNKIRIENILAENQTKDELKEENE